MMKLNFEVEK